MKMIFKNSEPMSRGARNCISEAEKFCHYSIAFNEKDNDYSRGDMYSNIDKSRSWDRGMYYSENDN